jgi:hypothetical protein
MLSLEKFNWGPTSDYCIREFTEEIFERKDYEKLFEVEEGDIVVDIGSSVGEFTYSILHKNPKHCYVVEPVNAFFNVLRENLQGHPVSFSKVAITSEKHLKVDWDGCIEEAKTMTFKEYVDSLNLTRIDFLKVDCEGGEYDMFSTDNLHFLKQVPKIVVEMHLRDDAGKAKFKNFRDNILNNFENYHVRSIDGVDIKWDLYNESFLSYYKEIYIYIDNRK